MSDHEEAIERLAAELERIAEELNDVSMSILADAIGAGSTERPATEKKVSQARRAVEKALGHLREPR